MTDQKTISFTIPYERGPLLLVAATLTNMAESVPSKYPMREKSAPESQDEDEDPVAQAGDKEPDATVAFSKEEIAAAVKEVAGDPAVTAKTETTLGAVGVGVELDSAGLPWDFRIHSTAKTKLAKNGTWKLIRGIEKKTPGIVAKVEAELSEAMAATPNKPIETAEETKAPPPPPPPPPPPTTVTGGGTGIVEFAALMKRITTDKPTPEAITAACATQGLGSIQLLGARPDLVEGVAIALFGE